jgi:regulatory protein
MPAAPSADPRRGRRLRQTGSANQDPYELAREICLRQLSYAARTRSQLAKAMLRRGIVDEVAENVLSRFESVGLIDDKAFAAAWVDSRHRGRGVGPGKIAHELRNRGIAPDVVSASIGAITPDAERATARSLVERRATGMKDQSVEAKARRLVGMLARRGFSPSVAYDVVREVLTTEGEELPEVLELLPDDT